MAIALEASLVSAIANDYANGTSIKELVAKYNVVRRTITRCAEREGVVFNNYENRRKIPISAHDSLVERYKNGEKPRDMAVEFGVKRAAIERIIAKKLKW